MFRLREKCSRAMVRLDLHHFTQQVAILVFPCQLIIFSFLNEENEMMNCVIPVGEKHFL